MSTISEKRANETDDVCYKANVVLVDIEGTTTSIDFVKNTLFPYVRKNLEVYLKSKWNDDEFREDLKLLQEQSKQDEANGTEGLVKIPEGVSEDICEDVKKNVLWQMDLDRKTKALKQLQGHIWRDAYKKGEVKAHIYPDVAPALKSWKQSGKDIYVYSSGSVEAQKLLFGHTQDGDLLELFSGYFDTSVGAKVEESSYSNIVNFVKCKSEEIIFFTDVPKEARAAKSAGLQAVIVVREGNLPITDEDKLEFPVIKSFDDIVFETSVKRRKKSEEEPLEQGKTNSSVIEPSSVQDVEMQEEPIAVKTETSKATEGVSSIAAVEAVDVQPDSLKQAPEEAKQIGCNDKDTLNNDLASTKQMSDVLVADQSAAEVREKNETNKKCEENSAGKLDVDSDKKQTESNGPKCPQDELLKTGANNIDTQIKANSDASKNSKDAILNENDTNSPSEKSEDAVPNNLPVTDNAEVIVPGGKTAPKLTNDKAKLNDNTETGEHDKKLCEDTSPPVEGCSESPDTDSKHKGESLTDKTDSTAELSNKTECTHTEKTEDVCAKTESAPACKTESQKPIDKCTVTEMTESGVNKTESMETDDLTPADKGDLKTVATDKDESVLESKAAVSTSDKEPPAAPIVGKAEEAAPNCAEVTLDDGKGKSPVEVTADSDKAKSLAEVTTEGDKADAIADGGKAEAITDSGKAEAIIDGGKAETITDGGKADATTDGGKAEAALDATSEGDKAVVEAPSEATTGASKAEAPSEATTGAGKAEAPAEATMGAGKTQATTGAGKAEVATNGGKAEAPAEVATDGGKEEAPAEVATDGAKEEAPAEVATGGGKAEAEAAPGGGKAEEANSMDGNVGTDTSDVKADSDASVKAGNETDVPMEVTEPMVTDDAEQMTDKAKPVVIDESEPMVTDGEPMAVDEAKPVTEGANSTSTNDAEPMVTEDSEPTVTNKDKIVNSTVHDGDSEKPETAQPEKETGANEESNECTKNVASDSPDAVDDTNCNSANKDKTVKDTNDSAGKGEPKAEAVLDTKTESENTENKISKTEDKNDVNNAKETENEVKGLKNSMNSCVENGDSTDKTDNTSEKLKLAAEGADKVTETVVST